MNSTKVLIPNKEWIVRSEDKKIGSVAKKKRGYEFLRKGQKYEFASLEDIKKELGISLLSASNSTNTDTGHIIYGFLCSSKPFEPIYNIKKKLPLFAKSSKSKSRDKRANNKSRKAENCTKICRKWISKETGRPTSK